MNRLSTKSSGAIQSWSGGLSSSASVLLHGKSLSTIDVLSLEIPGLTRRLTRGFDAQVNGAVLSIPSFRRDFGEIYDSGYVVPAPWLSAFNSISSVGQFFGGFICSIFADRFGRRLALAVGVVISCGGIFGELFSTARAAFLISKLILGVGLGFYLTIGPLYSSEVSLKTTA